MTDLTQQKWEFNKTEDYAIKWLEEHGFDVVLRKQYLSKTVFEIAKDGITFFLDIPRGVKDEVAFMKEAEKSFELHRKILKAKEKNQCAD